jgi:CubicO group peptidase (beta-lactamase class C family)
VFRGSAHLGCTSCESDSSAPGTTWPSATPEERGLDSGELAAVVERIDEQNLAIDSRLVVGNGVLVLDAYFYPYLGEQPHDVASVTKTVTSTLVGIAVDQGLLSLEQNLLSSFPDIDPGSPLGAKVDIELHHLLRMSSGLDCGRSPGEPEL